MKKIWISITIIAILLMVTGSSLASSGGDYEISFYTIDGGGNTSSGGIYEVTGTIGQPDASGALTAVSGGTFSLFGGFWGGGFLDYFTFIPLVLK